MTLEGYNAMTSEIRRPDLTELKPRITVFGVGGGGGNAVNNMINAGLQGVDFVVANTDAQALAMSRSEKLIQLGSAVTQGLGAGAMPEMGRAAAEECEEEIVAHLSNYHMAFITAGMGGGTGTGAAPVIARMAKEKGLLTVGVVTKPFEFEGIRRMKTAEEGIKELQECVDTLIVIPNQNLFRIANAKTTFAEAFSMADQVLYSGVASITDLMVKEGLINLDFADVRSVMTNMGRAMMGTGEASGEDRALKAAEAAIANPLLDETSMHGARGLLISITGGSDMTLFEVDAAANRIRQEVDADADVIFGAINDPTLEGTLKVSVVATGIVNDDNRKGYIPTEGPNNNITNTSIFETLAPAPSSNLEVKSNIEVSEPTIEETFSVNLMDSLNAAMDVVKEESLPIIEPKVELKVEAEEELINNFSVDDFSPIIRRSMEASTTGNIPISQPRKFWNKLLQTFKEKETAQTKFKFEAIEPITSIEPTLQQNYIKKDLHKIDDINELEIPAFLRKRAN